MRRQERPPPAVYALVLALALMALPDTANAATVTFGISDDGLCSKYAQCPNYLDVKAAPGEVNAVTITPAVDGSPLVRVEDTGAVLREDSAECTSISEHAMECIGFRLPSVAVDLGDGADTATVGSVWELSGGEGRDTLVLTSGVADGGSGDDVITCASPGALYGCSLGGGPGRDLISGGIGDDTLSGGQGTDSLEGRDGTDILDYSGHRVPVAVDLDAAVQVAEVAGVPEPTSGFEFVHGGSGDDVLVSPSGVLVESPSSTARMLGGGGNDHIEVRSSIGADGGNGNDRIIGVASGSFSGGRGNDELTGGPAKDNLYGGSGDDLLDGRAGRDWLSGDSGKDVLRGSGESDRLFGGEGADRFFGGGGVDTIKALEGSKRRAKDRVDCGPSRRDRAEVDAEDRVVRCERLKRKRGRR